MAAPAPAAPATPSGTAVPIEGEALAPWTPRVFRGGMWRGPFVLWRCGAVVPRGWWRGTFMPIGAALAGPASTVVSVCLGVAAGKERVVSPVGFEVGDEVPEGSCLVIVAY